MISFTPGAHSSWTEHHLKLLWAGIGPDLAGWGSDAFGKAPWVAAQNSSCFHILDFSHFFPAPRPPCRPEMLQTYQLPRASANHFVWNSGDGDMCHGFWSFPSARQSWGRAARGHCCRPTAKPRALPAGQAAEHALITPGGEKGNQRLCQAHQLFNSQKELQHWIIPGIWTISRPLM